MEGIAVCFPYKGGVNFIHDYLQPIGSVIIPDARPKTIDTPLMLIFQLG